MSDLGDYVRAFTERGECQCGLCIDKGDRPDPEGHTVDMVFFKVAISEDADAVTFRVLTGAHEDAFGYPNIDPFDGKGYNYMALGGWIGDQGLAMMYMAMGVQLGVFRLLSPDTLFPGLLEGEDRIRVAQNGLLAVVAA